MKTTTDTVPVNPWQPMHTAPRREYMNKELILVDLLAKTWEPERDTFKYQRFVNCGWTGTVTNTWRKDIDSHWAGLPDGWYPVGWMTIPPLTPPDPEAIQLPDWPSKDKSLDVVEEPPASAG